MVTKTTRAPAKKAPAKAPAKPVAVEVAQVKAVELHRILSDAELFAGHDATLPMIYAVQMSSDGHRLMAVATDRFLLGVSKVADNDQNKYHSEGFTAVFSLPDVHTLIKIAKTARRDENWRWVNIWKEPDESFTFKFMSGESLKLQPAQVEFPKWVQLIPESGTETARPATAYNAAYLARFAKVGSDDKSMVLWHFENTHNGGQKPTVVRVGEHFIGLIMPVRHDTTSDGFQRPAWVAP